MNLFVFPHSYTRLICIDFKGAKGLKGFLKISRDFTEFQAIFRDYEEFKEILKDSRNS